MKTLLTLTALALVSATPALAIDPKPAPSPDATATTRAPAGKPIRYCVIMDPPTGTRIHTKVCQTRDDWLKQGFDPVTRR